MALIKVNATTIVAGIQEKIHERITIDDSDRLSDFMHTSLENNILSRKNYSELFNSIQQTMKYNGSWHKTNLRHRCDRRPLGTYALQIYDDTRRENFLGKTWGDLVGVVLTDNGMDSSGKLIFNSDNVNRNPDKIVETSSLEQLKSGDLVEIKYDPVISKATYKCHDLKSCIKRNAYILTIFTNCWPDKVGPNGELFEKDHAYWCLFGPEIMEKMLELPKFSYGEVGSKESIQLKNNQFRDYFEFNKWES